MKMALDSLKSVSLFIFTLMDIIVVYVTPKDTLAGKCCHAAMFEHYAERVRDIPDVGVKGSSRAREL